MRVAVAVGELVMLAVVRDPADDVALDGELAEDREGVTHRRVGPERAVREQAVIPHGDPDARQQISRAQDRELDGPDHPVPQQDDRDDQARRREHDADEIGELASTHSWIPRRGARATACSVAALTAAGGSPRR
jgi:hypothetical protein